MLLRRLHKVMGGRGSGERRLNRVVKAIAKNMETEVCSVYLARADQTLELFATQGLRQAAVHKSRLKFGEGLVGLIAEKGEPLNVQEASKHPKFVYLPETGEEMYHSLMGVPILRSGRVAGVLVVQNAAARTYQDEEVEALQTVAMVLAELLNTGDVIDRRELEGKTEASDEPMTLEGQKLADGIAIGQAVFHEPKFEVTRLVADDAALESHRLKSAFLRLREQLDQMLAAADVATAGEHREVLEAYKMFAYDEGWQHRILEGIDTGLTAEAAVERQQQEIRARMSKTEDPYLRERLSDLEDLSNRLIRVVMGYSGKDAHEKLARDSVVIARTMGPAELLDYDRKYLRGIVLEDGSPLAHVTIVARALAIPILGLAKGALREIESGDTVVVDADGNRAFVRPTPEIEETYTSSLRHQAELAAEYAASRDLPALTTDGIEIELHMNAGLLIDLASLEMSGAAGIGLFRTEFQFMVAAQLPRLEAQTDLYTEVLDAAGKKPVVFRTLDIGGDKRVPFLHHDEEDNPALGWRAIRLSLERPGLLRYQMRAFLTAAAGRQLNVMFPMVAEVSEFQRARDVVMFEVNRVEKLGQQLPTEINIGAMLEVPSLAWQLEALLDEADFLSIGTNDLMQFFFASDRSNPKLIDRYDLLSPPVLSFLFSVVETCDKAGVPVSLCGEMGGRPLEAIALVGIGLKSLSISPPSIGPVRMALRGTNHERLRDWLLPRLNSPSHSLRNELKSFAEEEGIPL
jgi:phosphotransferase system enzyme I (PtsP)